MRHNHNYLNFSQTCCFSWFWRISRDEEKSANGSIQIFTWNFTIFSQLFSHSFSICCRLLLAIYRLHFSQFCHSFLCFWAFLTYLLSRVFNPNDDGLMFAQIFCHRNYHLKNLLSTCPFFSFILKYWVNISQHSSTIKIYLCEKKDCKKISMFLINLNFEFDNCHIERQTECDHIYINIFPINRNQ